MKDERSRIKDATNLYPSAFPPSRTRAKHGRGLFFFFILYPLSFILPGRSVAWLTRGGLPITLAGLLSCWPWSWAARCNWKWAEGPLSPWPCGPSAADETPRPAPAASSPATAPCWPGPGNAGGGGPLSLLAGAAGGGWLRQTARARLSPASEDPRQVAAAERQICRERTETARRLAKLCGVPAAQWDARARRVQARVQRMIADADRRRESEAATRAAPAEAETSWLGRLGRTLSRTLGAEEPAAARGPLAEEVDYHVMVDDTPAAAVAEIESHAKRYPASRSFAACGEPIPAGAVGRPRRRLLGSGKKGTGVPLGAPSVPSTLRAVRQMATVPFFTLVGVSGVERQYESLLQAGRAPPWNRPITERPPPRRQAAGRTRRGRRPRAHPRSEPPANGRGIAAAALQRQAIQPGSAEPPAARWPHRSPRRRAAGGRLVLGLTRASFSAATTRCARPC